MNLTKLTIEKLTARYSVAVDKVDRATVRLAYAKGHERAKVIARLHRLDRKEEEAGRNLFNFYLKK